MEEERRLEGQQEADANTGGTQAEKKKHRKRKLAIFFFLLGVLGVTTLVGGYYLITRKPLTQLPVVQAVSKSVPPRFVFSIYGVANPVGVAVSPDGQRIYVSEGAGERHVKVFDRSGRAYGDIDPPNSTFGQRQPVYIAVDKNGRLYVSDRLLNQIYIYSADGKYVGTFPLPAGEPGWSPMGVSVDNNDNLYVTEVTAGLHRVFVMDLLGNVKMKFGKEGAEQGNFSFPNAVAVDSKGRMFITNSNNGRIDEFDTTGKYITSFAMGSGKGTVGIPRGAVVDDQDRLYVADPPSHDIVVYDAAVQGVPNYLFTIGDRGVADGQFLFPNGLAWDATGRLYATDRDNNRVQVFAY